MIDVAPKSLEYHVYGCNKPSFRNFVNGRYMYIKTAHYSGHDITNSIQEAQSIMQSYLLKGWDVFLEVREVENNE